jgi:hypothetical protein
MLPPLPLPLPFWCFGDIEHRHRHHDVNFIDGLPSGEEPLLTTNLLYPNNKYQ